ncbi:hypothetical protein MES5069_510018 [Mesorhizobium escarrei]|uniref:Uncharacterized protein n=1 Tax=Mesorhizobium escarrei TaxID=666018 RepID=A0ABN8KAB3_9HYPH|nr:hypothetical protein MES5069_510018 [Mesorhizobium escarrei]
MSVLLSHSPHDIDLAQTTSFALTRPLTEPHDDWAARSERGSRIAVHAAAPCRSTLGERRVASIALLRGRIIHDLFTGTKARIASTKSSTPDARTWMHASSRPRCFSPVTSSPSCKRPDPNSAPMIDVTSWLKDIRQLERVATEECEARRFEKNYGPPSVFSLQESPGCHTNWPEAALDAAIDEIISGGRVGRGESGCGLLKSAPSPRREQARPHGYTTYVQADGRGRVC